MENARKSAEERIREAPLSSEGYEMLGDCLLESNPKQAYLCYENALFFCSDGEIERRLRQRMGDIKGKNLAPPKVAIIVLSYNNLQLTKDCLESIRRHVFSESAQIIFIDNASTDGSAEYLGEQSDIIFRANTENAGFPGGCNQGIALADSDADILLLNNDTVVMANTIFWLRMGLYSADSVGSAGSVANNAKEQHVGEDGRDMAYYTEFAAKTNLPMDKPYEYRITLIGFCYLIKRTVLEKTGYLDERFFPGNCEDDDLCLRILLDGYENILVKNSYLYHLGHASFSAIRRSVALAKRKLDAKYRGDLAPFFYPKSGIQGYGEYKTGQDMSVLEIGCGMGADLLWIKSNYPDIRADGVDRDPVTTLFREKIKTVNMYTYTDIKFLPLDNLKYNLIILNTESLKKQELREYIKEAASRLKNNGIMLIGARNAAYYQNWIDLPLYGTIPSILRTETVFDDDVSEILKDAEIGLHPVSWRFVFRLPGDYDKRKDIEAIINALPHDRAEKAKLYEVFTKAVF